MGRPKSQDKPELIGMSIKMEKEFIELIDELAYQQRIDRTKWVRDACKWKANAITCPECGALNQKGSQICSICKTPLRDTTQDIQTLRRLAKEHPEIIADIINKYKKENEEKSP
ncbi:MAG: zinc ribbon domain-containing protein [Methanocorpusculum sp.]|nr:zinc ribbon domain-containing protein [Methanocorpusculum sp.]